MMGFGDRPTEQDYLGHVPPIPQHHLAPKCDELVGELDTMKAAAKMLDPLPAGAIRRVLSWLCDRYGFALVSVDQVADGPIGLNRDTEPMPPIERNPVQVVPWVPPNTGTVVCNSMPVWASE